MSRAPPAPGPRRGAPPLYHHVTIHVRMAAAIMMAACACTVLTSSVLFNYLIPSNLPANHRGLVGGQLHLGLFCLGWPPLLSCTYVKQAKQNVPPPQSPFSRGCSFNKTCSIQSIHQFINSFNKTLDLSLKENKQMLRNKTK